MAAEENVGDYIIEVEATDGYTAEIKTAYFTLSVVLSNNAPEWLQDFAELSIYSSEEYNYYIPISLD